MGFEEDILKQQIKTNQEKTGDSLTVEKIKEKQPVTEQTIQADEASARKLEEMQVAKDMKDQKRMEEIRKKLSGDTSKAESAVPPSLPEEFSAMPPPPPMENSVLKERKNIENREIANSRKVGDVMVRNNVFVVHMLNDVEELGGQHNDNSAVSKKATYEDGLDILLSLEPSISASSVVPGEKTKLWPGASGFLLGGGEIGEAQTSDTGSKVKGIKKRGGEIADIKEIDRIVGRKDKWGKQAYEQAGEHGMNELIVNDPEVAGFFQHAEKDENGKFWAYDLKTKNDLEMANEERSHGMNKNSGTYIGMLEKNITAYQKRFAAARERRIPLYVMTGKREFYPCLGVEEDGSIIVLGDKITPAEVAKGQAGLIPEERKKIGERILAKNLFRKVEAQEEARKIIEGL